MKNGRRPLAMVLAAMSLAACGGGDSPTPVATATPTPTPPPPAPPTFSYTEYENLTGTQAFGSACESHRTEGDTIARLRFTDRGAVAVDFAAETVTVRELGGGEEITVGPAQLQQVFPYEKPYTLIVTDPATGANTFYYIFVFTPRFNGEDALYSRRGRFRFVREGEPAVRTQCFFGVATLPADLSGQANFSYSAFEITGEGFDVTDPASPRFLTLQDASASLDVRPGASALDVSFTLQLEVQGAPRTFGPITGTVPLASGNRRVEAFGTFDSGSAISGRVNGGFFGPAGEETGLVVTLDLDLDGDGSKESIYRLRVSGKR